MLQQMESGLADDRLKTRLCEAVNEMLVHDFNRLVALMYRIDISEIQLKQLLKENPHTDAALLITELILKRQEEKKRSRDSFPPATDIPEDERW